MSKLQLRRSIPTVAVAGALLAFSATSGATAALIITGKQIKDNTVTTKDIKNKSLTVKDLNSGAVKSLRGATGPAGAAGPAGPAGPAGAPGVSGYQVVTASAPIAADSPGEVTATCPSGKRVLSAMGYFTNSYDGTQEEVSSDGTRAWAYGYNYDPGAADVLNVDIVCATVS